MHLPLVVNLGVMGEPSTTQLLHQARGGDRAAFDRLMPRVYDELRQIARARLRRHRRGETLSTTALVHEAYLKLTAGEAPSWNDRTHFFALAARAMRFVLVGYARQRTTEKRGGGIPDVGLDALQIAVEHEAEDLISLDAALERLSQVSDRMAEVVEYRFFGGMTYEEIAEVTGRSAMTVRRDWQRARTWLLHAMHEADDDRDTSDSAMDEML